MGYPINFFDSSKIILILSIQPPAFCRRRGRVLAWLGRFKQARCLKGSSYISLLKEQTPTKCPHLVAIPPQLSGTPGRLLNTIRFSAMSKTARLRKPTLEAGYSFCSESQSCLRTLKNSIVSPSGTATSLPTVLPTEAAHTCTS